jgi:chromosome segregation ATPase
MRNRIWLAAVAVTLALPLAAAGQESVAEAARKAREKKAASKAAAAKRSYTNDNLPAAGRVNVIGGETAAAGTESTATQAGAAADPNSEQAWRTRFSEARAALANAEKELAVLQREIGQSQVQYYDDPQKALEQQTRRTEINEQRRKIEEKQKEVASLKQALDDLETELRRAGGNPGWARP